MLRALIFVSLTLFPAAGLACGPKAAQDTQSTQAKKPGKNLLPNPSFEVPSKDDKKPAGWRPIRWNGTGRFGYARAGRSGGRCIFLTSRKGGDLSWSRVVPVKPFSTYRLAGWIRTEEVIPTTGRGALFNLHGIPGAETRALTGTHDWTRLELLFDTGARDSIQVNTLFGGWGLATGKAWYDDLSLELLSSKELRPAIEIHADRAGSPISKYVYGQFIEHLGRCIYGGIWAEMLEDRKFFYPAGTPASPWKVTGPAGTLRMTREHPLSGEQDVEILPDPSARPRGIVQAGLALEAGRRYTGRVVLAGEAAAGPVEVRLAWGPGEADRETCTVKEIAPEFRKIPLRFRAKADTEEGRFEIVCTGTGSVRVGAVSLMPADNVEGLRKDTLALLRELDATVYRWPGGNFVSGYDWRDGIGDPDRRPTRKNPAWKGIEPNDFGIHEFMAFCRALGTEPYVTVNTGLGTAEEAADEVEYLNGAAGTPMGKLRAANGHPEPFGVRYFAVGNEMYGKWQLGHMPLEEYVKKHNRVVDAMRAKDPSIRVVAVGAVGPWTEGMFRGCADRMDLLSEHFYVGEAPGVMAHAAQAAEQVRRICRAHRRYRETLPELKDHEIPLAVDEWNYWYGPPLYGELGVRYHLKDALGTAEALHAFFRESDLVFMANYAQTVNVIGCIKTTKTRACFAATGEVLKLYRRRFGTVPVEIKGTPAPLDASAAWNAEGNALTLGVVNPTREAYRVPVEIRGAEVQGPVRCFRIAGNDPEAYNEPGKPPRVAARAEEPRPFEGALEIPPLSITLAVIPAER